MNKKILSSNSIEFKIDIGFNRFDSLVNYFGEKENGDIKGCSYDYNTGIATFSTKLLPFIYDYLKSQKLDTSCLNTIANNIKNTKIPIDISNDLI